MFRKIYIISLALAFIALMAGPVFAQMSARVPDQTVTINPGPVADKPVVNLTIWNGQFQIVTFLNKAGEQINVNNTATPGPPDKDGGGGNDVANNGWEDYKFSCPADAGPWTFTITQGANSINVIVNVICEERRIPTLTQWGMIILIALIIVTGIYLWMRKKHVPA